MMKHSPSKQASQLLAMSEKVGQVAQSLAQLALDSSRADENAVSGSLVEEPFSAEIVSRLIRLRRSRVQYMPASLIGEPVWDIALGLLEAEITGGHVAVSAVQQLTRLPEGVVSRWVEVMVQNGLVSLENAHDEREEVVRLDPNLSIALRRSLREMLEEQ